MNNFDLKKFLVENKLTANSRILNEETEDSNSNSKKYFTWLGSPQGKIVFDSNLQSLGNIKSNTINIPGYKSKVLNIPNIQRDKEQMGLLLGDAVFASLKDTIISSISNISDRRVRDFLKNPTEESAEGDEKLLAQTLQWKKWTESIPDVKDSKYLQNSPEFASMIQNPVQKIIEELLSTNSLSPAYLVWGILPYLAQYWQKYFEEFIV